MNHIEMYFKQAILYELNIRNNFLACILKDRFHPRVEKNSRVKMSVLSAEECTQLQASIVSHRHFSIEFICDAVVLEH